MLRSIVTVFFVVVIALVAVTLTHHEAIFIM